MKVVQDSKFTDSVERALVRGELADTNESKPLAALLSAGKTILGFIGELKANARRYNVDYANS
ncbi:hypothetical protein [Pigmentiphaga soli]